MAPTNRQTAKAATRAKVLEAARRLFEADGYELATIRGIALITGMSTGAIFASFTGKAELYRELFGHDPISPEVGRELLAALIKVVAVADRKTDEFDAAHAAIARATSAPAEPRQDKAA